VDRFTNVKSFSLSFEYDPVVMTYGTYTPNSAFGGTLTVTNNPPGTNGKSILVLAWSGSSALSLPNGSSIAALAFTYNSGTSALSWVTGDVTSCRYNDAVGNAFYDSPKSAYYLDGLVASHTAPIAAAWHATPTPGDQFTIPVKVCNFTNIGLFALTLDYDPGVLTYQGATLGPSIGGTFTASSPGPGRIVMGWSGTAATLPDFTNLIIVTFTYINGSSILAWFDDGTSCKYAETPAAAQLYDQPLKNYYVNGYIGPDQSAIWNGSVSTDWNTASNWNNNMVPGNATDVVIPAYAPKWPIFAGNLFLGIHCKTIILNTVNSRLTVTGNLTIMGP
jgi:hypothetical protein